MNTATTLRIVWQCQQKLNKIDAFFRSLDAAVKTCYDKIATIREKIATSHRKLETLDEREKSISKQIATTEKIKNRTQTAIDNGTLFDFQTAQEQVRSYIAKIDMLEEEGLIVLEEQDQVKDFLAIQQDHLKYQNKQLQATLAEQARQLAALQPEREEIEANLLAEVRNLPLEFEKHVLRQRSSHMGLVCGVRDRNCGFCGIQLPAMAVSKISRLGIPLICNSCRAINIDDN